MKPRSIRIANSTIDKAQILAEHFARHGPISACRFNMVPVDEPYDLVINATSAGVQGQTPPYPAAAISEKTFCYDLSYGLNTTPFSLWAREQGATILGGCCEVGPAHIGALAGALRAAGHEIA